MEDRMYDSSFIDPAWDFRTIAEISAKRFRPGGMLTGPRRNMLIDHWINLVGREKASAEIKAFVEEAGSLTKAAKDLQMGRDTLKGFIGYSEMAPEKETSDYSTQLRRGAKSLFEYLRTKSTNEIVEKSDLLNSLNWNSGTLQTYLRKNMLGDIFEEEGDSQIRILVGGKEITEGFIASSFSQVQNQQLYLRRGDRLKTRNAEYALIQRLGNGAIGHVWKAKSMENGLEVAIKVLNPRRDLLKPTSLENVKRRFSRESRNGTMLESDFIVKHIDSGSHRRLPFMVMELAETSLQQIIENHGKLSLGFSLNVVRHCLLGLEYLHQKKCIHRDIKPHNILLLREKFILGDLGIVKWSDFDNEFISAGTITKNDVQLGSFYYMSPEQHDSPSTVGPATDIYSLGATWYQMLTGVALHPGKIASQTFDDPSTDTAINQVIRKMLRYGHENRPGVARVLEVIDQVKNQTGLRPLGEDLPLKEKHNTIA